MLSLDLEDELSKVSCEHTVPHHACPFFGHETHTVFGAVVDIVRDRLRSDTACFVPAAAVPSCCARTTETGAVGIALLRPLCRMAEPGEIPLAIDDVAQGAADRARGEERPGAFVGMAVRMPAGRVLGTLCVTMRRAHAWRPGEVALVHGMAAVLEAELRHQTRRDHPPLAA